ncbi:MAG: hypothetical protein GKR89_14520 [Candidatus Latescibacteria bacterium]|nr:hypothetical protein [Candidatus Latescibacterota bacterium]
MVKQTKPALVRAEPFVVNKNLGTPLAVTAQDLTAANADGLPVVAPTDKQKYDFDRNGWLSVPAVLSVDECAEMRDFAQRLAQDPESLPEHERCSLGGPLQKLADHPVVVGFLNEFLAYPPLANSDSYGFRLDTSHLLWRSVDQPGKFKPHNGNGLFRLPWESHFYRCIPGKAWSGLTRVVWELNPVKKGHGGTLFVPASHKAAYPAPQTIGQEDSEMWETYECPAGSLVFFTESITHSAQHWTNPDNDRLAVFNLYNIVATRWHSWLPPAKLVESMPPLRQSLFREAYNEKADTFFPRTTPYMDG